MPALGSTPIALCAKCRRDTLPQLSQPSWHREKHRASATEREPAPDPRAEKIKQRKESRRAARSLLAQLRVKEMFRANTFLLDLKAFRAAPPAVANPDCDACLKLQKDAA